MPPGRKSRTNLSRVTPACDSRSRIAAYCVIADGDEYLLVRASAKSGTPGVWSLPGGAVDHGENPVDTVVRETAAETGLSVAVADLRDVLADMRALPTRPHDPHRPADLRGDGARRRPARPGRPADRPGPLGHPRGGGAAAAAPVHRRALGLPRPPSTCAPTARPRCRPSTPCPARTGCTAPSASPRTRCAPTRRNRVLLTRDLRRIPRRRLLAPARRRDRLRRAARARADPRAGRGDRPGGPPRRTTRRRQPPRRGLARPRGLPDRLARRPRVLPRRVARPAALLPDVGGSTAEARWFDPEELDELALTEVTEEALRGVACADASAYADLTSASRVITVYGRRPGGTDDIGGPVRHGESPTTAMVRHFVEQADLSVVVLSVLDVHAVVTPELHEDRVVFEVAAAPARRSGTSPSARTPTGCRPGSGSPRTASSPTPTTASCSPRSPTGIRARASGTCRAAAPTRASSPPRRCCASSSRRPPSRVRSSRCSASPIGVTPARSALRAIRSTGTPSGPSTASWCPRRRHPE